MTISSNSDKILRRAKTGVILPPEASTSWILDNALLWQAVQGDCVVIDIADVRRYQRLASQSYIDFLVAYLLALLINRKILCPIDYRQYLLVDMRREIVDCAESVADRNVRDGGRLYELARHGYRQYIGYARGETRENLYKSSGDEAAIRGFKESKRAATDQLDAIEHEAYEKAFLGKYANRLMTKCLAAREIANQLFKQYGVRLRVFDSPEYAVGADLLKAGHIISDVHRDQDFAFADLDLAAEIREKESIFTGGEYNNSIVYATIASVLSPDLYRSIKHQVDAGLVPKPDMRRVMDATSRSTRQILSKQSMLQSLVSAFLSFFPSIRTWPAFLAIVQLLGGLVLFRLARSESERLRTNMTPIDQFILLSTQLEQDLSKRGNPTRWTAWIRSIFQQPVRDDYRWQLSQKTMGVWVETEIYKPWFEDFETS